MTSHMLRTLARLAGEKKQVEDKHIVIELVQPIADKPSKPYPYQTSGPFLRKHAPDHK